MEPCIANEQELALETREFYRRVLAVVAQSGVPFLVGGAYGFGCYTGIARDTKDLDVFCRQQDVEAILAALAKAGYQTEITYPHWLGKAYHGGDFVDIIFGSGNGLGDVDDEWFAHSVEGELLGTSIQLCPAEEAIWHKAFIMERERFDGADVAHLLRARAEQIDWPRLVRRFGEHWRVLFSHLILFGFIYPDERKRIPAWVMEELTHRWQKEEGAPIPSQRVCQGTLLSAYSYEPDVERWGYKDARRRTGAI